jgi:aerobic carbon-monoxide dehydrogenase small subunit
MTTIMTTSLKEEHPLLTVELTVNGQPVSAAIEPRTILLDLIRDTLGLTGTKRSCDLQVCGACTVLVDGVPVSSCCTLAYEAHGKTVTTIEGLSRHGALDPVQRAFIETGAVQCGFCTSGMVLSAKSLLLENPQPTREEIAAYLGGNLCRCTGYWRIIDAVQLAGAKIRASENGGSS